jgi:hypothetical protein
VPRREQEAKHPTLSHFRCNAAPLASLVVKTSMFYNRHPQNSEDAYPQWLCTASENAMHGLAQKKREKNNTKSVIPHDSFQEKKNPPSN